MSLTLDDNGALRRTGLPPAAMAAMERNTAGLHPASPVPPVPTGYVPRTSMSAEQPAPKTNAHPAVWPLVMRDMIDRDQTGRQKYGVPLQPHNGRDVLVDAYQEALDLAVYLRQAIYERDGR